MVRLVNESTKSIAGMFLAASIFAAGCAGAVNDSPSTPSGVAGSTGNGGQPGAGGTNWNSALCPVPIFQQCKACHDGRGTAGTQMGLITYADFRAPSPSNPSIPVYQMVETRVHGTKPTPMPPTGTLPASDLASIDAWVAAGAPDCGFPSSTSQTRSGGNTGSGGSTSPVGTGGTGSGEGGKGGSIPSDIAQYLSPDGTYFIKDPPMNTPIGPDAPDAEYCFNLVAHGAQTPLPMDPTPFQVRAAEFYHAFGFKVPYTQTMVALSTKPIIDNNKVLHHWLLFHTLSDTGIDGSHGDEIGLQIGNELVSGWAPGGNPPVLPPGVGLEMPKVGGFMTLETHYFNTTGSTQPDRSGVRVCMTSKMPPNVATVTWLGSESINIPANGTGTATGICTPGNQSVDIHLVYVSPHMHKLGTHMKTVINRKGGGTETVVDKPFSFSDQRAYTAMNIVHPGDTLTTTCTWENTTGAAVKFGTSTTAEMCYDFVWAYPAHAMPNALEGGIEGSSNMCLGPSK
jgi:hypothetical protein